MLFLLKTKTSIKNVFTGGAAQENTGLVYDAEPLSNLISKDSDGDDILDWEESLWGTNPQKKDTNDDGVEDGEEITKLKTEQSLNIENGSSLTLDEENLTKTDQFSRELLSTIATLSQNGGIDQETIDKIGSSLAEQVKNSPVEKVFTLADLKITKDNSVVAVQNYNSALSIIQAKHPKGRTVMDVLQDFSADENNVNVEILNDLDPIIIQIDEIINDFIETSVPESIASAHLEVINAMQRLLENVKNIKLYDTDVIIALGAITQYGENTELLGSAVQNLGAIIQIKLK